MQKRPHWVDNDQVYTSNILPTVVKSEEKIEEDAPLALHLLKKSGALDLLDILGLTKFMKEV